jgi:hypothetical protein
MVSIIYSLSHCTVNLSSLPPNSTMLSSSHLISCHFTSQTLGPRPVTASSPSKPLQLQLGVETCTLMCWRWDTSTASAGDRQCVSPRGRAHASVSPRSLWSVLGIPVQILEGSGDWRWCLGRNPGLGQKIINFFLNEYFLH